VSALPARFVSVILPFAGLFRQRTWRHARVLLVGAILAPGVRTVTRVLRILGLAQERRWVNYHRVLSRAVWSPRRASYLLLRLLVRTFPSAGPLVFGIDETIERRRGKRIRAKGIYRDPVRSSHSHFVKASGLRWISVMLLAPIPWAGRIWALPVLTALAPSERADREAGRRHKLLTDWARQLLRQTQRWCTRLAPDRPLIVVGDTSYAVLELLGALRSRLTCITRLRLDARLFTPAPPRRPHTMGRPRVKGERLPLLSAVLVDPTTCWQRVTAPGWYGEGARDIELATGTAVWHHSGQPVVPLRWVLVRDPFRRFDPQALLCTDPRLSAAEVVGYYVRRWQVEVTFEETRRHLGVETQREWSERAIARTTPILLGLFSLVTLLAAQLVRDGSLPVRTAAWYAKRTPTFSDALAVVRRHWWRTLATFGTSRRESDMMKLPRRIVRRLSEAAYYAA
jgi:DDE superfamily endonuclease